MKNIMLYTSGNSHPYVVLEDGIIRSLRKYTDNLYVVKPQPGLDFIDEAIRKKVDLFIQFHGFSYGTHIHENMYRLKEAGIKTAIWLTDDPYYTGLTKNIIPYFDYIFTNDVNCVSYYQEKGHPSTHFVPLASNHNTFKEQEVPDEYKKDILFVGVGFRNRSKLFLDHEVYFKDKDLLIVGTYWEGLKRASLLSDKVKLEWLSPEETAKYYNGAKIVINLHRAYNDTDYNQNPDEVEGHTVNPRTYEISSCGAFQLVDYKKCIGDAYKVGEEIITFHNSQDLIEKIEYYLNNEKERLDIARRGKERTLSSHTFDNRVGLIKDIVFGN